MLTRLPIYDRIKSPFPKKLHPAVERAVRGGEIHLPGEKKQISRLEVWDRAVEQSRELTAFQRADGVLEETADRWASQEQGRVYNDRRDSYLDGGLEGGELLSYSDHHVQYSRLGPGTVDRLTQNTFGEGRILHTHLDLKDPTRSFQIETDSEGNNIESSVGSVGGSTPPPSTVPSGVIGLVDALKARGGSARAIFLDKTESLADYRVKQQKTLKNLVSRLSPDKQEIFGNVLEAARSSLPMELYHLALTSLEGSAKEERAVLDSIKKEAGGWAALESLPETSADGLTQRLVSYTSPQSLAAQTMTRGWDRDERTGLPIADSVIVGAGPGGLASGYHLANTGAHTVIFEAKSAGQAFSDDNAKSVKELRTSVLGTDILGSNWRGFQGHEASLSNQYFSINEEVKTAQADWEEATGEDLRASNRTEEEGPFETAFPRAGLYDHLQRMASSLSREYPDTFLIERSPVKDVVPVHDGLFRVTTHNGHQILARTLVPSTGFVGVDGELARKLPVLTALATEKENGPINISDDNSEMALAQQISENLESLRQHGKLRQAVIASDRKLGSPDIRTLVAGLPKGSHIGFVGGGESGVKGVLEVAALNPDNVIDFYTSRPLEPYQTQVPAGHLNFANIKAVREHSELKERTFEILKSSDFGSPITTASLGDLFELVGQGRVNIHNLGTHFDDSSVIAESTNDSDNPAIRISYKTGAVGASVEKEREQLRQAGLLDDKVETSFAPSDLSMVFTSVGYDTKAARIPDYLNELVKAGLFDPAKGSLDSRIVANSAGFASDTADTALAGRAVQGWDTPAALVSHLPRRETPTARLRDDLLQNGIRVARTPKPQTLQQSEVERVLSSGARDINLLESLQEQLTTPESTTDFELTSSIDDTSLAVQDPLRLLNQMSRVLPQYLSPSEKELVRRGRELSQRITDFKAHESE